MCDLILSVVCINTIFAGLWTVYSDTTINDQSKKEDDCYAPITES